MEALVYFIWQIPSKFFPYLASIGSLNILSKRQIYVSDFESRSFLIINAEKDHIFPPKIIIAYMELLRWAEIVMSFRMLKGARFSKVVASRSIISSVKPHLSVVITKSCKDTFTKCFFGGIIIKNKYQTKTFSS